MWIQSWKGEMATHSSILTWRIPGTEEPGRLQPVGLQRVRHDWALTQERMIWLSTKSPSNEFNKAFLCSQSSFPFYCLPVPWKFPWGTLKAESYLDLFPFLQEQSYISPLCDGRLSSAGWKSHIHKNAKEKASYISLTHTHTIKYNFHSTIINDIIS